MGNIEQNKRIKGEHNRIRFGTRMEDIEGAVSQAVEDLEILRALVRSTHKEIKERGWLTERTYDQDKAEAA